MAVVFDLLASGLHCRVCFVSPGAFFQAWGWLSALPMSMVMLFMHVFRNCLDGPTQSLVRLIYLSGALFLHALVGSSMRSLKALFYARSHVGIHVERILLRFCQMYIHGRVRANRLGAWVAHHRLNSHQLWNFWCRRAASLSGLPACTHGCAHALM